MMRFIARRANYGRRRVQLARSFLKSARLPHVSLTVRRSPRGFGAHSTWKRVLGCAASRSEGIGSPQPRQFTMAGGGSPVLTLIWEPSPPHEEQRNRAPASRERSARSSRLRSTVFPQVAQRTLMERRMDDARRPQKLIYITMMHLEQALFVAPRYRLRFQAGPRAVSPSVGRHTRLQQPRDKDCHRR
jgi:hypothetical protein